jgi:hypothetical protein
MEKKGRFATHPLPHFFLAYLLHAEEQLDRNVAAHTAHVSTLICVQAASRHVLGEWIFFSGLF